MSSCQWECILNKISSRGGKTMQKYILSRKLKNQSDVEWKSSTKGELEFVLAVLKLNLQSPELKGIEYKITPVS